MDHCFLLRVDTNENNLRVERFIAVKNNYEKFSVEHWVSMCASLMASTLENTFSAHKGSLRQKEFSENSQVWEEYNGHL